MALDDASQRYLASQGHGRLATVGPDGHPQNKPVGFHYNAELGAGGAAPRTMILPCGCDRPGLGG
jgi:Pyridoxamine 5'-phosphate oxidase